MKIYIRNESRLEEFGHWSSCRGGFKGLYNTAHGKWWGFCHRADNKDYRFYIFNPPKELRTHPHWANFYSYGRNWYGVAFAKYPVGLEDGIQVIERALCDAFAGKKLGQSQDVPLIKRKDSSFKKITAAIKSRFGLKIYNLHGGF